MWKIRKFLLHSGLELMTTRMIDEVHPYQLNHTQCLRFTPATLKKSRKKDCFNF